MDQITWKFGKEKKNGEGGNLISHPRNLKTNDSGEINIDRNEIFMIKENNL